MRLYIRPEDEGRIPGVTTAGGSGAHYKPDFVPGVLRERRQMADNNYDGRFTVATVKRPNLLVVGGILYVAYALVLK
tara:strand:+ start:253 stop:483 length:231 start_codon:yes stop_codon:yes gene_type:complete